jgi:glycyl-tRNA synthetase
MAKLDEGIVVVDVHNFPFGFKELEGIHSRTDFDLTRHEQFSGRKLRYFDTESEASYVPYVIETSLGLDRLFLATLAAAYTEEKLEDGSERVVLRLPAFVAPVQVALLPLIKKDGLPELARQIQNSLRFRFLTQYDEKDSIGKRYRRQDALGTPVCLTIDHQTLEDHCVTLRHRDSMQQERIPIAQIHAALEPMLSIESALAHLDV